MPAGRKNIAKKKSSVSMGKVSVKKSKIPTTINADALAVGIYLKEPKYRLEYLFVRESGSNNWLQFNYRRGDLYFAGIVQTSSITRTLKEFKRDNENSDYVKVKISNYIPLFSTKVTLY